MRQSTTMDRPAKKPSTGPRNEQDRLDDDREAIAGGDDDLTDDELDELEDDEDIDEGDEEEL